MQCDLLSLDDEFEFSKSEKEKVFPWTIRLLATSHSCFPVSVGRFADG
jgi:hypothetical protein